MSAPSHTPILDQLLSEYGYHGGVLLMERFIERSPDFPGGSELASELGKFSALLSDGLKEIVEARRDGKPI